MSFSRDPRYEEKRNAAHIEFVAWFRKTYRPANERSAHEFECDLDRLVMEISKRAYEEAQTPFVREFHAMRDAISGASALKPSASTV